MQGQTEGGLTLIDVFSVCMGLHSGLDNREYVGTSWDYVFPHTIGQTCKVFRDAVRSKLLKLKGVVLNCVDDYMNVDIGYNNWRFACEESVFQSFSLVGFTCGDNVKFGLRLLRENEINYVSVVYREKYGRTPIYKEFFTEMQKHDIRSLEIYNMVRHSGQEDMYTTFAKLCNLRHLKLEGIFRSGNPDDAVTHFIPSLPRSLQSLDISCDRSYLEIDSDLWNRMSRHLLQKMERDEFPELTSINASQACASCPDVFIQAVTHQNSRVTRVDVSGSWEFNPDTQNVWDVVTYLIESLPHSLSDTQNVWETLRRHAQRVGGFSITMYFTHRCDTQESLRQEFARKFADCPELEFHVDYRKKQRT